MAPYSRYNQAPASVATTISTNPTTTAMMVVPVQTADGFKAGNPTKLFDGPWYASSPARAYDVSRDGRRLLMIKEGAAESRSTSPEITVILGWLEELKQLMPTM